MHIIFEGLDRVGKGTQIKMLQVDPFFRKDSRVFHTMHHGSLPYTDEKDHIKHSSELYASMFRLMVMNRESCEFIFDRSHLGESVYAPLYRKYSGDYVFSIENKYTKALENELYLIVLVSDPSVVISRDDGNSFYKTEKDVQKEIDMFEKAFKKSSIRKKYMLNVKDFSEDIVHTLIMNFLTR